jgi:hypothetical protein
MSAKQAPPGKTPHQSRRLYTAYLAVGLLFLVASLTQALAAQAITAVPTAIFGALFVYIGLVGRRAGAGVQLINSALNLLGQGKLGEAEALLTQAEKQVRVGPSQRAIAIQRSMIALRRGDVDGALRHIDAAILPPPRATAQVHDRFQRDNALAIRAFLRASKGDREGARKDIATLRAAEQVPPQAQARAALAEAMLLESAGERAALRELLAKERALLAEATSPRERAIVRAYQRMLALPPTTVYRQAPRREAERTPGEEPPLAEWMARVAPGAAPFVRAAQSSAGGTEAAPSLAAAGPQAKAAVKQARALAERGRRGAFWAGAGKRLAILFGGAALLVGVLSVLPSGAGPSVDDLPQSGVDLVVMIQRIGGAIIVAGLAFFIAMIVSARRQAKALFGALAGAVKDDPAALAALRRLSEKGYDLTAAQAHQQLALVAERSGDLPGALAHVDQGLGRLSRAASRVVASDLLLPELCAERAFVLAATDHAEEAAAELESLNPAYPFLARARFRVQLVALARRGDLAGAARLAEQEALDLPLNPRDELLADAARVAASPESCGAGEVGRVKEELRTQAPLRRWMEVVAPGLLRAVELAAEGEGAAGEEGEEARSREAEEEARAEEEGEEARKKGRRGLDTGSQ